MAIAIPVYPRCGVVSAVRLWLSGPLDVIGPHSDPSDSMLQSVNAS